MLNQKKVEIFSRKFRKSLAKQFLEVALIYFLFLPYRVWKSISLLPSERKAISYRPYCQAVCVHTQNAALTTFFFSALCGTPYLGRAPNISQISFLCGTRLLFVLPTTVPSPNLAVWYYSRV